MCVYVCRCQLPSRDETRTSPDKTAASSPDGKESKKHSESVCMSHDRRFFNINARPSSGENARGRLGRATPRLQTIVEKTLLALPRETSNHLENTHTHTRTGPT